MNDDPTGIRAWLQREAAAITRRGADVRKGIAGAVAAAAQHAHAVAGGLADLARTAAAGAASALDATAARQRDSTLREVIDGIGDGLATAAQAVQLTVRESAAGSAAFAQEEVDRVAKEFGTLGELFADAVAAGLGRTGAHAAAQAQALRDHAGATIQRTRPAWQAAAAAARTDPLGLAAAAAGAGAAALRGAAGALAQSLGRQLQRLGVALAPKAGAG
jgi:hypothetical protein